MVDGVFRTWDGGVTAALWLNWCCWICWCISLVACWIVFSCLLLFSCLVALLACLLLIVLIYFSLRLFYMRCGCIVFDLLGCAGCFAVLLLLYVFSVAVGLILLCLWCGGLLSCGLLICCLLS